MKHTREYLSSAQPSLDHHLMAAATRLRGGLSHGPMGAAPVALLVSGDSRGFITYSGISIAANRLAMHVVSPLLEFGHDVHTLLCLDKLLAHNATAMSHALRIRHSVSIQPTQLKFPYKAQVARRLACLRELEQYEARTPIITGFVLLTRPDAVWYDDIPSLHTLAPEAITVRARMLRSGTRTFPLKAASVSFPTWFETSCPTRKPSIGSDGNNQSIPSFNCTVDAVNAGCVFADDQFAIMPRHLASAFFVSQAVTFIGATHDPRENISCNPRSNKTAKHYEKHSHSRHLVMQQPGWAARTVECQKCGFQPNMFESTFSQALLDTGCNLAIGSFAFVLLPDMGKLLNREPKQRVIDFIRERVLANHSPFEEHERRTLLTQDVFWDC